MIQKALLKPRTINIPYTLTPALFFLLLFACQSNNEKNSSILKISNLEGEELYLHLCKREKIPVYKNSTFGFIGKEPYGYNTYLQSKDDKASILQFYSEGFKNTEWQLVRPQNAQNDNRPLHYLKDNLQVTITPTFSEDSNQSIISIRLTESKESADRVRSYMQSQE